MFLTFLYILTFEVGLNIEDDYEQPRLALIPSVLAIWFITKPLALFTYFDDLLLTY